MQVSLKYHFLDYVKKWISANKLNAKLFNFCTVFTGRQCSLWDKKIQSIKNKVFLPQGMCSFLLYKLSSWVFFL